MYKQILVYLGMHNSIHATDKHWCMYIRHSSIDEQTGL